MRGHQLSGVRRLNRHWQSARRRERILYTDTFHGLDPDYGDALQSATITRDAVTGLIQVTFGGCSDFNFVFDDPTTPQRISQATPGQLIRYIINFKKPSQTPYNWEAPLVKVKTDIGDTATTPRNFIAQLDTDPNTYSYEIYKPGYGAGIYTMTPKTQQLTLAYRVALNNGGATIAATPFSSIPTLSSTNEFSIVSREDMLQALGSGTYYDWTQYTYIDGRLEIVQ